MDDLGIIKLLSEMLNEQEQTNVRLDRLEKQQRSTNLKLQELTLSNVKLADVLKIISHQKNEFCA